MQAAQARIAILRMEGTNCEQELFQCFARLGAKPEFVHINQVTREKGAGARNLEDFHALMIPGGFSAGDYVRAGAIYAARVRAGLEEELEDFVKAGKPVGGVCNGFQVLVELGLLPATGPEDRVLAPEPEAALAINDSNRFECRPVLLRHENNGTCVFTRKLRKGKVITLPVAHAEGKFTLPKGREERLIAKLQQRDQVVFRYVAPDGGKPEYPWNPNGALDAIAGVCSPSGTVFGMMPHPERHYFRHQHPDWTRGPLGDDRGDGRAIFESVLDYVQEKF